MRQRFRAPQIDRDALRHAEVGPRHDDARPCAVEPRQRRPQARVGVCLARQGPERACDQHSFDRTPSDRQEGQQTLRALGDGNVVLPVGESEPAEQRDVHSGARVNRNGRGLGLHQANDRAGPAGRPFADAERVHEPSRQRNAVFSEGFHHMGRPRTGEDTLFDDLNIRAALDVLPGDRHLEARCLADRFGARLGRSQYQLVRCLRRQPCLGRPLPQKPTNIRQRRRARRKRTGKRERQLHLDQDPLDENGVRRGSTSRAAHAVSPGSFSMTAKRLFILSPSAPSPDVLALGSSSSLPPARGRACWGVSSHRIHALPRSSRQAIFRTPRPPREVGNGRVSGRFPKGANRAASSVPRRLESCACGGSWETC